MNTMMLLWGLIQSIVMTGVIVINGLGWRSGWLAGAAAQGVMVVFGFGIFHGWTFLFLLLPMSGFIANWLKHENRKLTQRIIWMSHLSAEEDQQIVYRYCRENDVAIIPRELAVGLYDPSSTTIDNDHIHIARKGD